MYSTFTGNIEHIMSTELYVWDAHNQSHDEAVKAGREKEFDTVPVRRNGKIAAILYTDSGEERPITHDILISRDTTIPDALSLLASSSHPAFLVLYGQDIQGILTPSDFNKITARGYFYSLVAQLELELARCTRQYFADTDKIVELLMPNDKTLPQYRRKLLERTSGNDRKRFGLDLVHSLMLSEYVDLFRLDPNYRHEMGFEDEQYFEELFEGINEFRKKVMHPTRPLLNNEFGIEELNMFTGRVMSIFRVLEQ